MLSSFSLMTTSSGVGTYPEFEAEKKNPEKVGVGDERVGG